MSIPRVGHVIKGWTRPINITFITKTVVNHKVVKTEIESVANLNLQPMPPEKVNKKPEEQRSWKWFTVFMRSDIELFNDDEFIIRNKKYTIISKGAWDEAGYYYYEATEDIVRTGSITT